MESGEENVNPDRFFEDVANVKNDIKGIEKLHEKLQESYEESKTTHNAVAMKQLRAQMNLDVEQVLIRVKIIKEKLAALERSNAEADKLPGDGPEPSADGTRDSVVGGLAKNLMRMMDDFEGLRARIVAEYKETLEQRDLSITGEKAEKKAIENSDFGYFTITVESASFQQKATQEQRNRNVHTASSDTQERHFAVKELEKNLSELHHVFLDIPALGAAQGHQSNGAESQFLAAKEHQKSSRKCLCNAVGIGAAFIMIIILLVLPLFFSQK